MTILPDPNEFTTTLGTSAENGALLHPDVRDRFWGYEVRMTQVGDTLSMAIRFVSGLICMALAFLTVALLVVPSAFGALTDELRWPLAVSGLCCAVIAAHIYSAFRPIRVQVDTTAGEIREVIERRFGGEEVLSCYGMDAVASVEVVASGQDATLGQVHVRVNGYGVVPVGDGAVSALRPLRDRLAVDCGIEVADSSDAFWSGPLKA